MMKKTMIRQFISKYLRGLVILKRYLIALRDMASPVKATYAQHGEDRFIFELLHEYDLADSIYVDVGSNQPTVISNTYLFYRHGYTGVSMDANPEHKTLTRICRPKDTHLAVGCAEKPGILEFRHDVASVLSGFTDAVQNPITVEHISVMPLDIIMSHFQYRSIFLLSIDVEGMDFEVLKGASNTLKRTLFLLIEENETNPEMRHLIESRGFSLVEHLGCNILYRNKVLSKELSRTSQS